MGTFLSVIPPLLTIVLALWTRNVIVSLFAGILAGSVIINGVNFIPPIVDVYMTNGLKSNTNVLICMILIGIMLEFVKRSGGFKAFAEWCQKKINTPKQTLVYTFWFSMLFSIATNLGSLSIPRVMKAPTLQNNMPEVKVPMICTSVINAMSSMLPITNYILFFSGLIVAAAPNEGYDGYALFVQAIPFQFFAIVSIVTAGLWAYGVIPDIGFVKKATQNIKSPEAIAEAQREALDTLGGDEIQSDIYALIVPFGCLILAIPLFSLIAGKLVVTSGIFIGTVVSVLYGILRGRVKFNESMGAFGAGFRQVTMVFLILLFAFTFGQVVTELGFSTYVISLLGGNFSGAVIPMIAFLLCCIISYPTGSLSASAVIVFPLALPLALASNISIPLTIGACISGSHFGDLFSPVSDSVILPSSAMGVDPVDTSKALVPYRLIQLVIVSALYLVFGYIL